MEPPCKRVRVGLGDPESENFEKQPTEGEGGGGGVDIDGEKNIDQVSDGGKDKLMLSDSKANTSSHLNVELTELTRNEDEKCFLGDLKGTAPDCQLLNAGETKKEEENTRNTWLTEYAQIAFKEKENENKILKREYNIFVQEYAKTSNQILKVVAKQKKEIIDLKLRNGKQKIQLDVFEKGKEYIGECKEEAADDEEGILAVKEESLERKPLTVSFGKVGGDTFKDKEVLMMKGKEEIISLFNAELRDIEEGMKYLNEVIRVKESEILDKDKVLCQETQQRIQLEAQALEAKDAFKEALEAQMDEIEQIKKESNTASPKLAVFKRKLEVKKVLINQLTAEVENAKAALLAKERESEKMQEEHNAFVQEYSKCSKGSVDAKDTFKEVLESKEIELEQIKNDLKNKLDNVSHKNNFFKEALEAKSVVLSQSKSENENLKSKIVDLKNRNLSVREELEEERTKQKEEMERVQLEDKSLQEFVFKLQSENIEQEDEIALLKQQTKSLQGLNAELENCKRNQITRIFQLERMVGDLTAELERERSQNNLTQDVIFELEACNKKQDDQVDKLEKKIAELILKLETVNEAQKCEKEELEKQKDVLKDRNVSLKMKLIKQNTLQKEEKKSTEKSFNRKLAEMKEKHKDRLNQLKMSMQQDEPKSREPGLETNTVEEANIMENESTEPNQSKVEAFITQIESTDRVSEIDNLFAAMFSSAEEGRGAKDSSEQDAAPVACSSNNYTTRDLAFFSSEDEDEVEENLSRKPNSRKNSQAQPQSASPTQSTPETRSEVSIVQEVEALEEGELSNEESEVVEKAAPLKDVEVVSGGSCPLCAQNFPTILKLEVHASGCMQENNFSLKSCFVLLRNIKCGENPGISRENINPSQIPHHTIPYLVPGPKIFTVI